MLKELKTPCLQDVIDFVNHNSLSIDEIPPSKGDKKESKSGNEPKNREPTKSVKPKTKPENDHQEKKSSGVNIPRQSKKKANHQQMMPSRNLDTKQNYTNLEKMSNNGSTKSLMDIRMHPPTMHHLPMHQPNMHSYEAQQHFGNTRNHPGPMQMSPVGSGPRFSGGQMGYPGTQAFIQQHLGNMRNPPGPMQMPPDGSGLRFSGGQVGHPGTQAFNQQHRFVDNSGTNNFQMIQEGIDRRNMASNQIPGNQRGKRRDKVIIIKQS